MENNNVKVQATPSQCTEQVNKIENIESIVLPKSPDFKCCTLDSKPGIVYVRVGKEEFIALDLINETKCEVKTNWIRKANHVKIIRNLHDNVEGIESGKLSKRAIVNKQIDFFRNAVVPNFQKVSLPQIKNRAYTFIDVLGIEGGEYLVNGICSDYLKFIHGEPFERKHAYSKTLGEHVDYIEKFHNYMHSNYEFMYFEFGSMFRFLCESVPDFMHEYVTRDLEYLYDELVPVDELNYTNEINCTHERNYNLLNKMVYKCLHRKRLDKLNENVRSITDIDTAKEMQIVASFTDEEDTTRSVTLNEVKINTDYIKDNMLSINFDRDDIDMLLNLIPNEFEDRFKNLTFSNTPKPTRVSMSVRDVEQDNLTYAEVELNFNESHLFQYCPKTNALLAKEDYEEEVYKPVLYKQTSDTFDSANMKYFKDKFNDVCEYINNNCATFKPIEECINIFAYVYANLGMNGQGLSLEDRHGRAISILGYSLDVDFSTIKLNIDELPGLFTCGDFTFGLAVDLRAILERVSASCVPKDFESKEVILLALDRAIGDYLKYEKLGKKMY